MIPVVWGAEHFHLYTYEEQFTIVTDHKSLISMLDMLLKKQQHVI